MSEDSRWSCGPAATGGTSYGLDKCTIQFNLNEMRYVRQIQLGGWVHEMGAVGGVVCWVGGGIFELVNG